MILICNNCALISVNCVSIKSQTSFGDVVTLHRKVDSDVSAVCADAGDDADGVVIDGAPFVLGSRNAPLHAHSIADLIKAIFYFLLGHKERKAEIHTALIVKP
jgi:hypothetical protein